jgi:hypothetical protein
VQFNHSTSQLHQANIILYTHVKTLGYSVSGYPIEKPQTLKHSCTMKQKSPINLSLDVGPTKLGCGWKVQPKDWFTHEGSFSLIPNASGITLSANKEINALDQTFMVGSSVAYYGTSDNAKRRRKVVAKCDWVKNTLFNGRFQVEYDWAALDRPGCTTINAKLCSTIAAPFLIGASMFSRSSYQSLFSPKPSDAFVQYRADNYAATIIGYLTL